MFSAGVLELMKMGVVTGANKKIDRGRVVASFLLGTKDFYEYVDFNRSILMMDIGYVNDPFIIAKSVCTRLSEIKKNLMICDVQSLYRVRNMMYSQK
jgi:Acetyl-CoA hydrolase